MTLIPAVSDRIRAVPVLARHLPARTALDWLSAGWRDLWHSPGPSLGCGLAVTLLSAVIVIGLFRLGLDHILLPALAGFLVAGPVLAIGLYDKSRRIAAGQPVLPWQMVVLRPASGGQVLFAGALLMTLVLLWMRAAVIIYALFLGVQAFPGFADLLPMLFGTPTGWSIIIVGSAIGALFAAFAFAISLFAIPMLTERRTDALTAMGTSLALVWFNLPVALAWGAIVAALCVLALVTGLVGLIVVFPLLGHGTWHAWRAMQPVVPAT